MKRLFALFTILNMTSTATAQPGKPCTGQQDADTQPGVYTNHTKPKYPFSLKAASAQEKTYMTNQLIAIEKLEEASRKNFQLTGCVARVSFSSLISANGNYRHAGYSYQLAAYQNVCHVTQHIVKTVDEYRTVLRVDVNPTLVQGSIPGISMGIGDFAFDRLNQYQIPIDALQGPNYTKDAMNKPSRVSKYISEKMVMTSRSNNYKDYHSDFLKLNNGNGYVENWMSGDRYGTVGPKSYLWIDRRYLITKPGIPLMVPISRKQYLEDMLEYFEIEKANFNYDADIKIKQFTGSNDDFSKKRLAAMLADKAAYPKLYEAKKNKVKELLATKNEDWLQQQAIVGNPGNTYDANERLKELGKFYDKEDEYKSAIYVLNPEYFKQNTNQPAKPIFMEVQFRYEINAEKGFSQRLFNNFEKNFNFDILSKMVN